MNKLLVALVLLCIGDMVLAYGSFYDSDRARLSKTKENVEKIKEEVEILNNEMQLLDAKVDRLLESKFGTEETRWPPLELLNASRTWSPVTNETTHTVCYHDNGSGDDVSVEWWSYPTISYRIEDKKREMESDGGGETVCTSVISTANFSIATLSVQRRDIFLSYRLHVHRFENRWISGYGFVQESAHTNQTVNNIQLNTIQVINDGDVVYDEHRDDQALLKVRTHFLDKYSTDNLKIHAEVINPTTNMTDKTVCDFDVHPSSSSCNLLPSSKKLWDSMELDIGVDTHINGMTLSGYATVSATTKFGLENPLLFLQDITVSQDVVIRPTSQPDPYPDNFLNVNFTREDESLKVCKIDDMDSCILECSARGNNIEEVNFFVSVNGTTQLIPDTSDESDSQHIPLQGRSRSLKISKPDEPTEQNITCSARNLDGLTASANISVVVIDQIKFVYPEMYTKANDTTLMVVCTVQGYPLANVTLQARQNWGTEELDFDKIVVQQNMTSFKVKVTGYLTLPDIPDVPIVDCGAEAKYSKPIFASDIDWMTMYGWPENY